MPRMQPGQTKNGGMSLNEAMAMCIKLVDHGFANIFRPQVQTELLKSKAMLERHQDSMRKVARAICHLVVDLEGRS